MPCAITLDQEPILIEDTLPTIGEVLPAFSLVTDTLNDATLEHFAGQYKILNIFPSIDTTTSAESVRTLESLLAPFANTALLHISADLPFALSRFKTLNQLSRGVYLSTLRGRDMLKHYGVLMVTSKLAGLPARALMVADQNNHIQYVELVPDLNTAPNYLAAIASLEQAMTSKNG